MVNARANTPNATPVASRARAQVKSSQSQGFGCRSKCPRPTSSRTRLSCTYRRHARAQSIEIKPIIPFRRPSHRTRNRAHPFIRIVRPRIRERPRERHRAARARARVHRPSTRARGHDGEPRHERFHQVFIERCGGGDRAPGLAQRVFQRARVVRRHRDNECANARRRPLSVVMSVDRRCRANPCSRGGR